ncbi:AMP-binding protein [Lentzea sp. DG1S-22]|uniref:AMP-binding protein n=1 Tax=Lentzea sp. DG1S-22 TaxID=3108822 RepID=UPI002E794CE2|nr:AMP-binding protein [Lentzea sp. DG1S-22]WVH82361.1 AMP-binding protein [Lentzea sp. DG1S-22]
MEVFDHICATLSALGIEDDRLVAHSSLRADLGLDSTELTQLEVELSERFGFRVDLWSENDYTISQVADLVHRGVITARHEEYRRRGWWREELLDELVLRQDDRPAEGIALKDEKLSLTRAQLVNAVSGCARGLADAGIQAGDTVVVQLPNQVQFVILVLALVRLGAHPVLTLPVLREHEIDVVLTTARPVAMAIPQRHRRFDYLAFAEGLRARHAHLRVLLVSGGADLTTGCVDLDVLTAGREQAPERTSRDATGLALFLLSSGTTGAPKLIPRTHEAYCHIVRTSAEACGLSDDTVYLAAMPATHGFVFGHPGILGTLASGGRVVLGSAEDPAAMLALVERERVTHCALTPALARQWLTAARSSRYDLSSMRVLQIGGAPLDPATAEELMSVFSCRIQQVYGMCEGLLNYTRIDDPLEIALTTQGRPVSPGDETVIVDGDGLPLPDGHTGELWTRGPSVVESYHGGAAASSFTSDGFYRTGDLVYRHATGNLVVAGRIKDLINRGGEKIPADELEALAQSHPSVRAAAAVAMPHRVLGETVCLYVVPGAGPAPGLLDIRRFLESKGLARFKLPERLVEIDELPLIGVGKVDKVWLRKDIASRVEAELAGRP